MSELKKQKPIFEQKCPHCGGSLVFVPGTSQTQCEYCGSIIRIEEVTPPEIRVRREDRDRVLETMPPLPIYNCLSCGAEVIAAPQSGSLTCPYCQNNIVLTNQFSGTIKPDGIIPFAITPDNLPESVRKYYKSNRFLAKDMFTKASIGPVTGMYVPFWVFDCDVHGNAHYTGVKRGATRRSGDYLVTKINHYKMERGVQMSFKNLAVDASSKMNNALMDSVQPYSFDKIRPFDVGYLAGYVADRFDETSEETRKRTDRRVIRTAVKVTMEKALKAFSSVSHQGNSLEAVISESRYYLLPIYVFDVEYEGKKYHFGVNGQTGKVVGKLPNTKKGEDRYYWKNFGIGFGIAAAIVTLLLTIL